MRIYSKQRDRSGFTLIEVMIAVVVLATGLLAMAVLQAKLASNSADAKARSRIVALITSVIDKERALGYGNIAAFNGLTASAGACLSTTDASLVSLTQKVKNDINCAQSDAGVTGITLSQTVTRYYGTPTAGSFSTTPPAATVIIYGDYKQINLSANWTDATGAGRSLAADTIASNLGLNANASVILSQNLTASANMVPVVHELNPANTAGVIPIAVGSNTNAASTNPVPTIRSDGANATTFNTLNYSQGVNDTSSTSTIQKRVETEVAECVCQGSATNPFGADTLNGHATFRPTYWNGTQYTAPDPVSGGVPHSSAAASINQSAECDVCCRDHNDTGIAATEVKYDAVTGDTNRYKVSKSNSTTITTPISLATSGTPAAPVAADVTSDAYLDACRFIRVDGLWRVATDIEASHVGLIATNNEQGVSSNPATPYPASQILYKTFVVDAVKSYLAVALPSTGSPAWTTFLTNTLVSLFNTSAPDVPTTNPVLASTDGTYRYLHAHGLYIDHLEVPAIAKLNALVSSSCPTTAPNYPTCLLSYLPFNTINIGSLAAWLNTRNTTDQAGTIPLAKTVLSLGSGNSISSTCGIGSSFFGGCVTGLTTGYGYATARIGHSNSGIAGSIAVSPYELVLTNMLSASQQFRATSSITSDRIYAQVFGPDLQPSGFSAIQQFPTAALNTVGIAPTLTWAMTMPTPTNGSCPKNTSGVKATPNPYSCGTTTSLTTPTTVTVASYNLPVTAAAQTTKRPCAGGINKVFDVPGLICYRYKSATLSTDQAGASRIDCASGAASCYNVALSSTGGTSKTTSETTAVQINTGAGSPVALSNTYLNVLFEGNGSALGTVDYSAAACLANGGAPIITAPTTCN